VNDNQVPESKTHKHVYRVLFATQGEVYEVYVKDIYQSELYGFIEAEQFLFGSRSQLVVDPSEEKLKNEFSAVRRSYIPLHLILRIDEVEKEGVSKVIESKGNVMPFGPIGGGPGGSGPKPKT